jgi:hypothetical protein
MTSLVYTSQQVKLTKRQRAAREATLKEQRAIKKQHQVDKMKKPYVGFSSLAALNDRGTKDIPSKGSMVGSVAAKPVMMYTGDQMLGIGQLHKSNAVPVFKQEEAEEIARMRR